MDLPSLLVWILVWAAIALIGGVACLLAWVFGVLSFFRINLKTYVEAGNGSEFLVTQKLTERVKLTAYRGLNLFLCLSPESDNQNRVAHHLRFCSRLYRPVWWGHLVPLVFGIHKKISLVYFADPEAQKAWQKFCWEWRRLYVMMVLATPTMMDDGEEIEDS